MIDSNAKIYSIEDIVSKISSEIQSLTGSDSIKAGRKLKGADLERLQWSISKLIFDSVAIRLTNGRKAVASIHLRKDRYKASRYQNASYRIHVERAFVGMQALGYLKISQRGYFGNEGHTYITRYFATKKLLELFRDKDSRTLPVILQSPPKTELIRVQKKAAKEKNGKLVNQRTSVEYQDTAETNIMRSNLQLINSCLEKHWVDLEFDDESIEQIQQEMLSKKAESLIVDRNLNFTKRCLYRVFNDTEFTTGGRFYGGWWQEIPSRYRQRIIIDGKRTEEYDYSNLHPTILYLMEGIKPPEDSYSNIYPAVKGWEMPPKNDLRKGIKIALNSMLNAKAPLKRPPRAFKKKMVNCTWAQLTEAILAKHKPIQHYFFSNVGLALQTIDSSLAEHIMMHFVKIGYPVLPMHDSFIIHNGLEEELKDVMKTAFLKIMETKAVVDKKQAKSLFYKSKNPYFWFEKVEQERLRNDQPVTNNVAVLLQELDVGHELRLQQFRKQLIHKSS
jgi:hypothetical protein